MEHLRVLARRGPADLVLAFRSNEKELMAFTLDGQITFFDIQESKQTNIIDRGKDVAGGRKADDRVAAAKNASGKTYNRLTYTADGWRVLVGGNSKYVVLDRYGPHRHTQRGQDRMDMSLHGASRSVGDISVQWYRQEASACDSRQWACIGGGVDGGSVDLLTQRDYCV